MVRSCRTHLCLISMMMGNPRILPIHHCQAPCIYCCNVVVHLPYGRSTYGSTVSFGSLCLFGSTVVGIVCHCRWVKIDRTFPHVCLLSFVIVLGVSWRRYGGASMMVATVVCRLKVMLLGFVHAGSFRFVLILVVVFDNTGYIILFLFTNILFCIELACPHRQLFVGGTYGCGPV